MQNKLGAKSRARTAVVQTTDRDSFQQSNQIGRIQQRLTVPTRHPHTGFAPPNVDTIPSFQSSVRGWWRRFGVILSFVLIVLIPTAIAGFYYSSIASRQYVAEFRFTVKDSSPTAGTNAGGLLAALGNTGGTGTENYLVTDYLTSRQAVEDLQSRVRLIDLYSRPDVDRWSRYDSTQPMERFVQYWQKMVTAYYDQVTGVAVAQVRAFTPDDALLIARNMVSLSEELINRIALRTTKDRVKFAEQELEKAQDRLKQVRLQMMQGRPNTSDANTSLLLDLERQIAQNFLATAMQSLEQARATAAIQYLYITPYVQPSLPQSSTYPKAWLATLWVGAFAFAFWLVALLVARSIFERS